MSDGHFNFPTAPDPVAVAQWAGLARTLIAALAGAGILGGAWAAVSAEQIANLLTALLTVGGALVTTGVAFWSMWQKRQARRLEVASAVASAEIGTPVVVTVTPEGMPNVATRVSATEAAAAPSVPAGVTPSPAPRAAA